MDFEKLSAERYSLRKYSDRPVEPEKLALILEAGRNAPTAHNLQPQRIFVIQSPEALAKADDRRSIDRLIDLGYITCENLTACIDRIGTVKDAAMTGYLLEVKRRRFGRVSMDFEL